MAQNTEKVLAYIARAAGSAIVGEVSATPKPGLVDRLGSGAHKDMDYFTFLKSTAAIGPYLKEMAAAGCTCTESPEALFRLLRPIGIQAEQAMFQATEGVNTHKGMIFSMGTVMAAAGYYYRRNGRFDSPSILELCGTMTAPSIEEDFSKIDIDHPKTHGERLFAAYGIRGIRGEVQAGFPSVRTVSLPALQRLAREHADWNEVFVQTLFTLMANVEDSNVLYRGSLDTMQYVKKCASEFLLDGGIFAPGGQECVQALDEDFIQKNISPGGCADLLAVTIFAYLIQDAPI